MEISITYCAQWNYKPNAVSLAAKIKQAFNVDAKLIASGGGVFDVVMDADLVYSKRQTGTFPDEDRLIEEMQAA